ncbi:DUF29 domain-containing protein [Gloeothece citriformis]|nr:DUF29 domain-containing protein [Gloeothece citriformis]
MPTVQNHPVTSSNSLYDQDFYQWLMITVKLLQERAIEQIDIDNLIKELEETAKRTQITVKSNLRVLLMNLLQYKYQPSVRCETYQSSLLKHRLRILDIFAQSPSLKPYYTEVFDQCYLYARKCAVTQTNLPLELLPETCPFTQEETLNLDYLPQ